MKYFYLLLLLVSFTSFSQSVETLSWDAASLNDKVKLTLRKTEFEAIYKKADSIVTPKPGETCGTEEELDAKFYFYKGVKFELDNGILNFRRIDFTARKGMYLSYKGTKFNENYTLATLRGQFPGAWSVTPEQQPGETLQMVKLKPELATEDFEWHFYFNKGKLQAIECWFPCD
jgi:hypothetical protein